MLYVSNQLELIYKLIIETREEPMLSSFDTGHEDDAQMHSFLPKLKIWWGGGGRRGRKQTVQDIHSSFNWRVFFEHLVYVSYSTRLCALLTKLRFEYHLWICSLKYQYPSLSQMAKSATVSKTQLSCISLAMSGNQDSSRATGLVN